MSNKYNIALIPLHQRRTLIQLSGRLAHLADRYALGKHSFPHITLCQFFTNDSEIESVWDTTLDALPQTSLHLSLNEWSFTTSNNKLFWIALLPDQREPLIRMQKTVAHVIDAPQKKSYDPHLTLINTQKKDADGEMHILEKEYSPIQDEFVLAIGKCDEAGQITQLLHVHW